MVRVTETPALRPRLEPSDPEELAEFAALLPSGVARHASLALAGSPSGVRKSIGKVRTEAAGFLFFDSGSTQRGGRTLEASREPDVRHPEGIVAVASNPAGASNHTLPGAIA